MAYAVHLWLKRRYAAHTFHVLPEDGKQNYRIDNKHPLVLIDDIFLNTFAASYLNTQGLNNSCLKSRQRRP